MTAAFSTAQALGYAPKPKPAPMPRLVATGVAAGAQVVPPVARLVAALHGHHARFDMLALDRETYEQLMDLWAVLDRAGALGREPAALDDHTAGRISQAAARTMTALLAPGSGFEPGRLGLGAQDAVTEALDALMHAGCLSITHNTHT